MNLDDMLHPRNADGEFREVRAGDMIRINGRNSLVTDRAPHSQIRGFRRVGDHPRGTGGINTDDDLLTPSVHPLAGGVWIDPARPGTRHAPRYLNDAGMPMAGMVPKKHRTTGRKEDLQARRREGMYGTPEGSDRRELRRGDQVIGDRLGYQGSAELNAYLKRQQARARLETARQPVRRTPRGTQVEGWMGQVDARIARTRGGR